MFETYSLSDMVWPMSIVVLFLSSAPFGKKRWCIMESIVAFVFGSALILIPSIIFRFQIVDGKLDEVHSFLLRQTGAMLVGQAVAAFLCRNSLDARMFGNIFYANVFGSLLLLINQIYSAHHLRSRQGIRFNDTSVLLVSVGIALWMVGSLLQLIRYREIGGYIRRTCYVNAGLLVDHFGLLLVATLLFAFPLQLMKLVMKQAKFDGVHLYFLRSAAALMIRQALVSNAACGLLYTSDRRNYIVGRLTSQILVFGSNILGHFVSDIFTLYHVVPFMATGFYITFLLTLVFRVNDEKKDNAWKSSASFKSCIDGFNGINKYQSAPLDGAGAHATKTD